MSKKDEALKLALETLEELDGIDTETECVTIDVGDTIAAIREALAEQPATPFGIGGGLVAIKTLLSRDPCAHAKVAIEMIDAMLAEQPAQQQCRTDGRCQYAIDSGAEGMGHCPKGKCVMPAQQPEPARGV